jgi:uncharacterized DUF497 family protein
VRLSWDEAKRAATLELRGLDFASAQEVFAGTHFSLEDARKDYGEKRFITIGRLSGRMVVLVWTPRGKGRHVISMRKANDREQKRFTQALAQN